MEGWLCSQTEGGDGMKVPARGMQLFDVTIAHKITNVTAAGMRVCIRAIMREKE